MGCTLSIFVLNIRYIYPYINLITVFLQELTHVIQRPDLSVGCHEFVLTNVHLVSCWYYLITRQNWNFKLFNLSSNSIAVFFYGKVFMSMAY